MLIYEKKKLMPVESIRSSNIVCMVLTDNVWLYTGLSTLFPDVPCYQIDFNAETSEKIPDLEDGDKSVILVDCRIFRCGEWQGYQFLTRCWPNALVIWLTDRETGTIWPVGSEGDCMVSQMTGMKDLKHALRGIVHGINDGDNVVKMLHLTHREKGLLPYFLQDVSVSLLSQQTGSSEKALYGHRENILEKMGFRSVSFLLHVYWRNRTIFDAQWWQILWGVK